MSSEPKLCMFCQLPKKMTDEHVWGEWVKEHLERTANKHTHANIFSPEPGKLEPVDVRIRAGDHIDSTVRTVCEDCNSGWLSGIQAVAKPFLIPLFNGESCVLDSRSVHVLSAWIAMATMTGEHFSREGRRIAITQSDRDWLMNRQSAPAGWAIWIGHYERESCPTQWVKATFPILDVEDIRDVKATDARRANLQTTAFTLGQLFVFAMSCEFPEIATLWDWRTAVGARVNLRRIWPAPVSEIKWPPPSFGDARAKAFASAVIRYYEDLAIRTGYA